VFDGQKIWQDEEQLDDESLSQSEAKTGAVREEREHIQPLAGYHGIFYIVTDVCFYRPSGFTDLRLNPLL
jgi:hypothetical protein